MVRNYQLLIFDLDGTLIDSQQDLSNGVNAARGHLGLPPIDEKLISSYVGNGAPVLMRRALGDEAPQSDVDKALAFFLDWYRVHMLDTTVLYPGVRETLDRMHGAGVRMAVLTNKPVRISEAIVAGLGLASHFQRVYGGNSFAEKKPSPIGIETLLDELNLPRQSAMMIGDTAVDVRTARNAGIAATGVTFGFQPESFQEHPPDFLIHHMPELAGLVLAESKL